MRDDIASATDGMRSSDHDSGDLADLGYDQQLHRSLGTFASFAAGFSFVSILTTIFQLFGLGYGFAGPAFFWTWPIVFIGQFLVALCFAELAAHYPISGAIYQWSRRLGGEIIGWFGGWLMILALIVTGAAAAIALQVVLPSIWSGFQLIGDDSSLDSTSGAANAVLLGSVLLAFVTVINCIGIRWMSYVNSIGVTIELVGVLSVILALITHAVRGPQVVFDSAGMSEQSGSYAGAFIMSGLMAAYVMVGFGSAGELAEETKNPRRIAPRTIRAALSVSALGGGLLIIAALMAAPSLTDGRLASEGLPYVLNSVLGNFWGKVLLVAVTIAILICVLAVQTAASRLIFSMARDQRLPFSPLFSKVNSRTGTPLAPPIFVGVACVGILLVNLGNSAIFATLSSVCIIMIYIAYLTVTAPLLWQRFGGWPRNNNLKDAEGKPVFALGKWGIPVNIAAVVYGLAMTINLAWPRAEIFDPAGDKPWMRLSGIGAIGIAILLGLLCFPRGKSHPKPVEIGA